MSAITSKITRKLASQLLPQHLVPIDNKENINDWHITGLFVKRIQWYWRENSSRYRQWTPLTVAILPLYAQIPYLTKHTWRPHTRLRHTHNSVGSALHTHRRDPDTRIQVGHTTNTQFQYTLQCNTQVRHVRSVRTFGPEGPSRVLKLPVSRDAPAHSLTTHGASACQPTQDRALGSILYFIPHSSPFSFEAVETILHLSLHRES